MTFVLRPPPGSQNLNHSQDRRLNPMRRISGRIGGGKSCFGMRARVRSHLRLLRLLAFAIRQRLPTAVALACVRGLVVPVRLRLPLCRFAVLRLAGCFIDEHATKPHFLTDFPTVICYIRTLHA